MLLREFFSRRSINQSKLLEGGNSRAIDLTSADTDTPKEWKGRPAYAEKVDLTKFPRNAVTAAFIEVFDVLNKKFKEYSAGKTYQMPVSKETGQYPNEGEYLWPDFDVVTSGHAFNGSAEAFFNKSIPDEQFVAKKDKVGDIDLTIPDKHMHTLWYMLSELEGKPLTKNITYIGQNKPAPQGLQINAVFDMTFPQYGNVFPQVDFEASEYELQTQKETGKQVYYPTIWAKFSHSSHWNDIQAGIKGVFHKYLLRAITSTLSVIPNAVLLTPASGTGSQEEIKNAQIAINSAKNSLEELEKIAAQVQDKLKKKEIQNQIKLTKADIADKEKQLKGITPKVSKGSIDDLAMSTFSVLYGIRDKLALQRDASGRPLVVPSIDDPAKLKTAYKEVPAKQSKYETDLQNIFMKLFGRQGNVNEIEYLKSYTGLLTLLKPLEKDAQKANFVLSLRDKMLQLMFGMKLGEVGSINSPEEFKREFTSGQGLEREDWQTDLKVKVGALRKMWEMLPSTRFSEEQLNKILFLYYGENGSAYRSRTGDLDSIPDV